VTTRATYTDNVAFDEQGTKQGDTIFELIPNLLVRGEGKRFRLVGNIGFDGWVYAGSTRANRVMPFVDLTANLEAIERFFFIEAGVVSRQTSEDVFAARPDGGSSFNTVTTTQYRVVPTFEGRLGSDVQYRLRSANSWTDVSGTKSEFDGQYLGEHSFRLEHRPSPMGWSVEAARSETRFQSVSPPSAITDSARVTTGYAFAQGFVFDVRGGYETTNLVSRNQNKAIYGADLDWRPTERTDLNGLWERRFFGSSWRFRFNHRMPRLAWDASLSRDVATFPQAFLTLPPTNNVAALLDAAFTTRFPDPAERSRVVADLIARQGLPSSLASETSLFAQQVSIVTSRNASIAYLGVRNSIAMSIYSSKNEQLPDAVLGANALTVAQDGISITLSHQLSTSTTANLTSGYIRTRGLGVNEGDFSKQKSVRLQVTRQLAPKTNAFVGARVQEFNSNVGVGSARENAAFVGLGHSF